jgi:hypothetical protein
MKLATLMLAALAPMAAETAWRAGAAQAKITPAKPLPLAGYAQRATPFDSVESDIFVKALALEDGSGHRALLLTSDVLGFAGAFSERLCARIVKATGVPREAILVSSSHTHTAPIVALEMNWPPGGEYTPAIQEWLDGVESAMARIAGEALGSMRPARLSWGTGVANFVMNRREPTEKGIVLGVNPRGPADRSVPVLRVSGADGKPLAIVFGAAAHAVASGSINALSADYPGYAQSELQRMFPGAQAMFVAGACGDANAYPRRGPADARAHGTALAAEVARVLGGPLKPVKGPLRTLLRRAELPLQPATRADLAKFGKSGWEKFFVDGANAVFERGGSLPATYSAPFALWRFGDGLTLVGLSGEPVYEYVAQSADRLGPLNLWVAGYTNDVFGYLPSARIVREGGYESRGLYIGVGLFQPSVERAVMDAVEALAREAGRLR